MKKIIVLILTLMTTQIHSNTNKYHNTCYKEMNEATLQEFKKLIENDIINNKVEVIKKLQEFDDDGVDTPLHVAIKQKKTDLFKIMYQCIPLNGNINLKNYHKRTLLDLAYEFGNIELLSLISSTIKNSKQDMAKRQKTDHSELYDTLQSNPVHEPMHEPIHEDPKKVLSKVQRSLSLAPREALPPVIPPRRPTNAHQDSPPAIPPRRPTNGHNNYTKINTLQRKQSGTSYNEEPYSDLQANHKRDPKTSCPASRV